MTDREKAIVMAYTGYCMLAGDKLSVFYEYIESIIGRPVYTHEMGTEVVANLIKEKARPDFIALCADESSSGKPNKWIATDVIDDIKAEIDTYLITEEFGSAYRNDIKGIIDKHISPTGAEGSEKNGKKKM